MCFYSHATWMWIVVRLERACPLATSSVASHLALHVSSRAPNLAPFTNAIMQFNQFSRAKRTWQGDTDHFGVYHLNTDERVTPRHSDFGIQ